MFKNKELVIVLVITLIFLGGAAIIKFAKSSIVLKPENVTKTQPTVSLTGVTGTLKSLFGKTQSCIISYPNNDSEGTVYISDKKFRGDFTSKSTNGKGVISHAVSDGVYTYAWSSNNPTGVKIKLDVTSPTASAITKSFNLDQKVGLNCSPWVVDVSKFAIPTNIQFTNLTNMLVPKATTGTEKPQTTSPCNQVTDPITKASCLKTLSEH